MNTSCDAPYLDCAYKLVEYAGQPRRKRSTGKATWPGCRQAYRRYDAHGVMTDDTLALQHDGLPGKALLQPSPPLAEIRAFMRTSRRRRAGTVARLEPIICIKG